jgi:hypothetical protein
MIRHLLLQVREKRQVIAQNVDRDRRKHKEQGNPHPPVAMGPLPVRTLAEIGLMVNTAQVRSFVPGVSVVTLIHFL